MVKQSWAKKFRRGSSTPIKFIRIEGVIRCIRAYPEYGDRCGHLMFEGPK